MPNFLHRPVAHPRILLWISTLAGSAVVLPTLFAWRCAVERIGQVVALPIAEPVARLGGAVLAAAAALCCCDLVHAWAGSRDSWRLNPSTRLGSGPGSITTPWSRLERRRRARPVQGRRPMAPLR